MRVLVIAGLVACGGSSTTEPPPKLPDWDKSLPEASVLGEHRGLKPARGIVHLHSPYSHDACDNMPRDANGVPNEPCLQDLRAALCTDHIDFADLTDHDDTMADESFTTLFSMREPAPITQPSTTRLCSIVAPSNRLGGSERVRV